MSVLYSFLMHVGLVYADESHKRVNSKRVIMHIENTYHGFYRAMH